MSESQKELRKEKSSQREENRKEGKRDNKDNEKDKEECKGRLEEKHKEMTEENNEPTKEQDVDNNDVSGVLEVMSAKPEDSTQDERSDRTSCSPEMPLVPDCITPNYVRSPAIAEEYPGSYNTDIVLAIPVAGSGILSCIDDKKQRATQLLSKGVMPFFPPAKQEWHGIPALTILDGPVPLQWPPINWETFSPDQKLHAWEMAAIFISSREALDFSQDRNYLLSLFNFLSLPGSSMPILPKDLTNEVNMRLCNYRAVCDIALFGTKNIQQEKFLNMMESSAQYRDTSLDWIVELIEKHNVNLRLPKLPK